MDCYSVSWALSAGVLTQEPALAAKVTISAPRTTAHGAKRASLYGATKKLTPG